MSNKPRVSIGMPVYNGEKYLREAVDSILNQTFSDFELIISDNGSTDRTEEICRTYVARDPRIRYYRNEENRGAAWNFNRVFKLSKGEYFKWVAADDVCAPEFISKCVEALESDSSAVLAYTKVLVIDEKSKPLTEDARVNTSHMQVDSLKPDKRFSSLLCYSHSCDPVFGVIRNEIFKKTSRLGNFVSSDRVLLAQLSLFGRFIEIPQALFFRRYHGSDSVASYPSKYERGEWFDPAKKGKPTFPAWRLFFEYLISVKRSSLRLYQKLDCYLQMLRWIGINWIEMTKDLFIFIVHLLRPSLRVYHRDSRFRGKCFFKKDRRREYIARLMKEGGIK